MATPAPNIVRIAQYDGNRGLTQTQTLAAANGMRARLLSNREFDGRLQTDTWRTEKEIYPVWTGTLTGYNRPNEKLGKAISYTDPGTKITYTLEVPSKLVGTKDIALVVNHLIDAQGRPLFEHIENGNQVLVKVHDQSKIQVVEAFPRSDGWYLTEQNGMPTGNKVNSSNSARYLWQVDGGSYVGLVARGYGDVIDVYYGRRNVGAYQQPSGRFGVLGETTGAQAPAAARKNGADLRTLAEGAANAVDRAVGQFGAAANEILQPVRELITKVQNQ
jgi:hypothetical protein